jgi:hypothetical protein
LLRRWAAGTAATVLLATAVLCQGRVFLRRGAAAQWIRTLEQAGGRQAYEADVDVNAGQGHLRVFRYREPLSEVAARLERAFPDGRFAPDGGALVAGTVQLPHGILRLVLVELDFPLQTAVFGLEQSAAAAAESRQPPAGHPLADVPAFPGSRPLFFAADRSTRTSLAVAGARTDAAAVREFYRATLPARGWSDALPASGGGTAAGGLAVYVKPDATCIVFVEDADAAGACRVALLHKPQARGR